MSATEGYLTNYDKVCSKLETLKKADVREITRSYGNRPLHAVTYGKFEPIDRKANLSSAFAAGDTESFYGTGREKQSILIHAAMHAAEMESIAGVMNLISVMENGCDLDGIEWPELYECGQKLRVVIVPVVNPDGRARIDSDDPTIWNSKESDRYRHGTGADGKSIGWPACKTPHPRDPKSDTYLGGYFNDAGVNPLHGIFLDRDICPEIHAIADLASEETPDCVLDLHSCGAGPFFILGTQFINDIMRQRQNYIDGVWRTMMRAKNLPAPNWTTISKDGAFVIDQYICHQTGSLPLLFEGGTGERYKDKGKGGSIHRQIIETYLVLFHALFEIGATEGFKGSQ